jgi:hypothetical protein
VIEEFVNDWQLAGDKKDNDDKNEGDKNESE